MVYGPRTRTQQVIWSQCWHWCHSPMEWPGTSGSWMVGWVTIEAKGGVTSREGLGSAVMGGGTEGTVGRLETSMTGIVTEGGESCSNNHALCCPACWTTLVLHPVGLMWLCSLIGVSAGDGEGWQRPPPIYAPILSSMVVEGSGIGVLDWCWDWHIILHGELLRNWLWMWRSNYSLRYGNIGPYYRT